MTEPVTLDEDPEEPEEKSVDDNAFYSPHDSCAYVIPPPEPKPTRPPRPAPPPADDNEVPPF